MASISFGRYRGVWALFGQEIDNLANGTLTSNALAQQVSFKRPNPNFAYHITIFTKDEIANLNANQLKKLSSMAPDTRHIFSAGVGGRPSLGVYWVMVIWAAGQQIRKQFGLGPKHFHITLSDNDIHDVDKGIASLLHGQTLQTTDADFLDHTIFTLHTFGQHESAKGYSRQVIKLDPDAYKGFLRLADTALASNSKKLAMLAYACAYERATGDKIQSYCIQKLVACSKYTEWGHVFQEHEIGEIEAMDDIAHFLLEPWSDNLREIISNLKLTPSLMLESRHPLYVPTTVNSTGICDFYELPRFFRWLIPFHFALMSTPRNENDITALASRHLGIRHVLTLTEETPLKESWFERKTITNTFLPIPNYHPPSIEQMDLVIRLLDDHSKLPILVHCGGGKGRAGTVAACYLAAFGFGKPILNQDHPELSAAEAISTLRAIRPGSIETAQQEDFVSKWCSTIWKRQSVYPDLPSEPPPSPMQIEGTLKDDSNLFILVGLPGSGKSWFSESLLARNPSGWIRISQDETRSRDACETEIGRTPSKGKRVLLDRCNTSASERKSWLELAANWAVSPVCVYFDYGAELCTSRAQMRAGHPTLPPGGRVRNAVEQMRKIFVKPGLEEGFKAIVTIRSFAASQEAVLRHSPPVSILKFPRTPHLIDLGAATSDDIHVDASSFSSVPLGDVVITEKIDGANMGFSLSTPSSDGTSRILVQNRSHYVNSSTHEQFKKLGLWVERHEEELRSLLSRDPFFPERYILYGEWVYTTHSIPYTRLPDLFIAYDLYDRSTQSWADTKTLHGLLESTSISTAPIIHQGTMPTDFELLQMIQRQSMFYDGRVEGVYVKVEVNHRVKHRGKVVRSDFISGNEHWTRGGIRANELRPGPEIAVN